MVRLGKVALDGTKLRANASRHKAMSYRRMVEREKQLEVEIDRMLAEAERQDAAEDARLGPDSRDDDLPDELNRRVDRLLKIREAKRALEEEARREAAERAAERAEAKGLDEQAKAAKVEAAASKAVPRAKAQRNFTDPDARIMKMSDGAFHECYNGQAVVDEAHQVIVAADTTQCAADAPSLLPMLAQTTTNCGRPPGQLLADAGYCAEESLRTLAETHVDALIATDRWQHGEPPPPAPRGRIPANATAKERMAQDADEEGQGGLRQTEGHRRAGVRTDDHPPERPAPAASRPGRRPRRVAAALRLPQPSQALPHGQQRRPGRTDASLTEPGAPVTDPRARLRRTADLWERADRQETSITSQTASTCRPHPFTDPRS